MARVARAARRLRSAREAWRTGERLFLVNAALAALALILTGERSLLGFSYVVREPAMALASYLALWRFLPWQWIRACRLGASALLALEYVALCATARLVLGGLRPSVFLVAETRVHADLWLMPWFVGSCFLISWLALWMQRPRARRPYATRQAVQ